MKEILAHWSAEFVALLIVLGALTAILRLIGDAPGRNVWDQVAIVWMLAALVAAFKTWRFFRKNKWMAK